MYNVCCVQRYFYSTMAELNSCDRESMAHKGENISCLAWGWQTVSVKDKCFQLCGQNSLFHRYLILPLCYESKHRKSLPIPVLDNLSDFLPEGSCAAIFFIQPTFIESPSYTRQSIILKPPGTCDLADSVKNLNPRLLSLHPNEGTTIYCPHMSVPHENPVPSG